MWSGAVVENTSCEILLLFPLLTSLANLKYWVYVSNSYLSIEHLFIFLLLFQMFPTIYKFLKRPHNILYKQHNGSKFKICTEIFEFTHAKSASYVREKRLYFLLLRTTTVVSQTQEVATTQELVAWPWWRTRCQTIQNFDCDTVRDGNLERLLDYYMPLHYETNHMFCVLHNVILLYNK